jgi:hypothetical protein
MRQFAQELRQLTRLVYFKDAQVPMLAHADKLIERSGMAVAPANCQCERHRPEAGAASSAVQSLLPINVLGFIG